MEKVNWIRKDIKSVKSAAVRRNQDAMYELATRYLTGRSVRRNDWQGRKLALQAAAQGHAQAMVLAGCCLIRGIGGKTDGSKAAAWFFKATRLGNAAGYYNLGGCYLLGIGRPRSRKAALLYYREASARGFKRADEAIKAIEACDARTVIDIARAVNKQFAA